MRKAFSAIAQARSGMGEFPGPRRSEPKKFEFRHPDEIKRGPHPAQGRWWSDGADEYLEKRNWKLEPAPTLDLRPPVRSSQRQRPGIMKAVWPAYEPDTLDAR